MEAGKFGLPVAEEELLRRQAANQGQNSGFQIGGLRPPGGPPGRATGASES